MENVNDPPVLVNHPTLYFTVIYIHSCFELVIFKRHIAKTGSHPNTIIEFFVLSPQATYSTVRELVLAL